MKTAFLFIPQSYSCENSENNAAKIQLFFGINPLFLRHEKCEPA